MFDTIEIDGREFVDLGNGVTAEVMDIEVEEIDPVTLSSLFAGPADRSVASMFRPETDGARPGRTRPRTRGGRGNTNRRAIQESLRAF